MSSSEWPDLPSSGFLSARAATPEDVEEGTAVFSMSGQGQVLSDFEVPQYVLWIDDEGKQHPKLLIQAEQAPNGLVIVGLRDFAGNFAAATLDELVLLGRTKPA